MRLEDRIGHNTSMINFVTIHAPTMADRIILWAAIATIVGTVILAIDFVSTPDGE
jgi:hypothetical protein